MVGQGSAELRCYCCCHLCYRHLPSPPEISKAPLSPQPTTSAPTGSYLTQRQRQQTFQNRDIYRPRHFTRYTSSRSWELTDIANFGAVPSLADRANSSSCAIFLRLILNFYSRYLPPPPIVVAGIDDRPIPRSQRVVEAYRVNNTLLPRRRREPCTSSYISFNLVTSLPKWQLQENHD